MSREDGKWVAASDLGPRMRSAVNKVLGRLKTEGSSFHELHTGFKGDPVDPSDLRFHTTAIFLGVGPGTEHPDKLAHLEEARVAEEELRESFDYTLTKANYKAVIEAYRVAEAKLVETRPVIDERRTREEREELNTILAERKVVEDADRAEKATVLDEVKALAPAGTEFVIVAQLKEDRSDPQSDYFSNATKRCVAIGFQGKGRTDFKRFHQAAAEFPETAHLGSQEALTKWLEDGHGPSWGHGYIDEHAGEHRDNFSMGSGNYLSDHGYDGSGSGWRISRTSLDGGYPAITEIAEHLKVGVSA